MRADSSATLFVVEQAPMKDRAAQCTKHCVLKCVDFAASIMEACATVNAKVMDELGASLASETMGGILALIQPDFPNGVQKKMLAALEKKEAAELFK